MSLIFFFFNDTATTEIYTSSHTLSLHDALPTSTPRRGRCPDQPGVAYGSSVPARAARSEEHTSELQSRELISYAVFCLKTKTGRRVGQQCRHRSDGADGADHATRR